MGTDQGLKYLYIVNAQNKVQYRRVTLGALQEDGLRVISTGLEADDWVVVSGLQQIRPRIEVTPDRMPMPIPVAEAEKDAEATAVEHRADPKPASPRSRPLNRLRANWTNLRRRQSAHRKTVRSQPPQQRSR